MTDRTSSGGSGPLQFALDLAQMLHETGRVMVPVKPTQAMILAGVAAGADSVERAVDIWNAMIRAAELSQG